MPSPWTPFLTAKHFRSKQLWNESHHKKASCIDRLGWLRKRNTGRGFGIRLPPLTNSTTVPFETPITLI